MLSSDADELADKLLEKLELEAEKSNVDPECDGEEVGKTLIKGDQLLKVKKDDKLS